MFERAHHQRIAQVLEALNGDLLRQLNCLFGGGTAIALRYGEFRESRDIDFLVSDLQAYRQLREYCRADGLQALARPGRALSLARELRMDQYGIRCAVAVGTSPIKFEIIHEGRIPLAAPTAADQLLGIATLNRVDTAASKLLANADRWADDGVFSRDIIDLAMLRADTTELQAAVSKAETAYGPAIRRDVDRAIDALRTRHARLERCLEALDIRLPRAVIWRNLRQLQRRISQTSPNSG